MISKKTINFVKATAAVVSGLLLWVAFPPHAQADSAWMALVPLFLLIRHSRPRAAAGWAGLSGLVFWVLTLSWFPAIIKNDGPWPLVLAGQAGLSIWCAAFMALFAYVSARAWQWAGAGPGWRRILMVLLADPFLWGGTEVIRGQLFSGFAWNFLGVSQVSNLPLIQIAAVAGVYGVSAILIMVNGAVVSMVERSVAPLQRVLPATLTAALSRREGAKTTTWMQRGWRSSESFLPLIAAVACWFWGLSRVEQWHRQELQMPMWRVALIQPNSPCIFTINDDTMRRQLELLLNRTSLAGTARPDLVVWPETAVLGSVPYRARDHADDPCRCQGGWCPVVDRYAETEHTRVTPTTPDGMFFYNAAWLFTEDGEKAGVYRKRHLVPFGEYIPFDKCIPWLQQWAPTGVSCTPGDGPGILHLRREGVEDQGLRLGPLICFEDTVPALSRQAVMAGARLLVLMTNDAWFNGSIEPLQHFNQSIFRAVENGVPLLRAANSGVSGTVDPVGRIKSLESNGALTDFDGFMVAPVAVPPEPLSAPYTHYGDWVLGNPGAILVLAIWLGGMLRKSAAHGGTTTRRVQVEDKQEEV